MKMRGAIETLATRGSGPLAVCDDSALAAGLVAIQASTSPTLGARPVGNSASRQSPPKLPSSTTSTEVPAFLNRW
jgi:hypothetical protein